MRWEQLFADLDSQFSAWADAEDRAELADRQRHAAGTITITQRLCGAIGTEIRVRTRAGRLLTGIVREVGPDWLLLAATAGEMVIPTSAVAAVTGLVHATGGPLSAVAERFALRLVLRGIARDRSPVALGVMGDTELYGTIDRVGADFIELAEHATWEARRAGAVRAVTLIPLAAIDSVRAIPAG